MSAQTNRLYEFGDFILDSTEKSLFRGENIIQITPKVFETLHFFVENAGRLIEKDELMRELWRDHFVEESNITFNVKMLRKALGDDAVHPRFIQTVQRRGYRFIAEVRSVCAKKSPENGWGSEEIANRIGETGISSQNTSRSRFFLGGFVVFVFLFVVAAASIYFFATRKNSSNELTSIPALRGTKNADAYRYYLNALNLMGRVSLPVAQEAIESSEEAVRLDPGFARAYAALARGRVELSNLVDDPKPDCDKARIAVGKAFVLDAASAEGFQASGMLKHRCEWDFDGAESDLHRALVLDPRSDSTHWAYAFYLNSAGRTDEAIGEIEQAIRINPNPVNYHIQHGIILYCARRYDDSIAALRHADEIGHLAAAHGWLWSAFVQKGDDAQAFEWFIKLETEKQITPDPARIEQLKQIYQAAGWKGIREMQLETELANPVYLKGRFYRISRLEAQLGKTDDAFKYLNMAIERHDAQLLLLKSEPTFDPLRSDQRFAETLSRIGFPQ